MTREATPGGEVHTIDEVQQNDAIRDLDRFWPYVSVAQERVLLLDYDGTLAPFRAARDEAYPYGGVREALGGIMAAGHTRVVVISGRAARDVVPLLGLPRPPEIWGTHGWERLYPDGRYELASLPTAAAEGLVAARSWFEAQGWRTQCETKPASLALHWRGLDPHTVAAMRTQVEQWSQAFGTASGLELHPFDGGVELRAPGWNKGAAVTTILGETGPGAALAYLGDDLTDEDAFAAIKGKGLAVLVRTAYRPTVADAWLRPAEDLLQFLGRWHAAAMTER